MDTTALPNIFGTLPVQLPEPLSPTGAAAVRLPAGENALVIQWFTKPSSVQVNADGTTTDLG